MDEIALELLQAAVQVPVVGLGFWFGWRIYIRDQKRIDYLISVIVSLCQDVDAETVRQHLNGKA